MKNTFLNVLFAALLVLGAAITASPVAAHNEDMGRVRGVIAAVDTSGSTLTVTPNGGDPDVVLNVDSTTWIRRNGQAASLGDLQVGDLVNARYNPTSMLAYGIMAKVRLVRVRGVIAAVDPSGSTLTVTPNGGDPDVVLNVDSNTSIKRNDQTASLSDLQVGDLVEALYNPSSMLALNVVAKVRLVRVRGTIAAVDTSGSTLTVTPNGGDPDVVLNVDSNTLIKRNGQTASLGDLQVGDKVGALYNPTNMLAISIEAKVSLVWLKGIIAAVDTSGSTLTITPKDDSGDVVLNVNSSTLIKRNGKTASLGDLQVGDQVEARYYPTSMLAYSIEAKVSLVWLEGVIAAVNTSGGTLTITPKDDGADVVLNVDSTSVITLNGKTASLGDLQAGDKVEALYNPTSKLAAFVAASNQVWLAGVISAVDTSGGTVTITPYNGDPDVVLNVDSTTSIKRNWQTANLGDLQPDDHVLVLYNPTSMLAARIFAWHRH